jgi:hypothetical protein
MRAKVKHLSPIARKDELVIEELPEEILVYDTKRHKAHCLNQTAALVWKNCDGQTSIPDITRILQKESKVPVDDAVATLALEQLGKAHLLQEPLTPPAGREGLSRREAVRRIGFAAAISLPLVTSIVAPTPTQAATCLGTGAGCTTGAECCSGICAGGPPTTCV